jgi:hypothetical protein
MRGLGCVHDELGVHGSHAFDELCGAADYPDEIDRTDLLRGTEILDQSNTNSCTRHGLARAIQLHARATFDPDYELPSARHMTATTRALLGDQWSWDGCSPGAVVEAIQGAGYCRESECPWMPESDGEIFLHEAQLALDQRDLRAHRLVSADPVADIKRAFASGAGVGIGTDVDQRFCDWEGAGVWTQTGPRVGAHFQAVVGYRPGAFLLVGSYGHAWAWLGLIWISEDQIADSARTRSIWVVDTVPKWSGS